MADAVQVQVVLPYLSGLPADVAVNDFTITVDDITTADFAAIGNLFAAFYNFPTDGIGSPSDLISSVVSRATDACTIQFRPINLVTGHLGVGSTPAGFTLDPLASGASPSSLPLESALCVSWSADTTGTSTVGRRRGRNYIGPWSTSATSSSSGHPPHPIPSLINGIALNARALIDGLDAIDASLRIWSRANHDTVAVVSGWIDDEMDTQRRRGMKATTRVAI